MVHMARIDSLLVRVSQLECQPEQYVDTDTYFFFLIEELFLMSRCHGSNFSIIGGLGRYQLPSMSSGFCLFFGFPSSSPTFVSHVQMSWDRRASHFGLRLSLVHVHWPVGKPVLGAFTSTFNVQL